MPESESRTSIVPAWLGWVVSAFLLAVVAFLLGRQWEHDHKRPAEGTSPASTGSPQVVESTKTSPSPVPDVRPAPRLEAAPTDAAADAARDEKLQQDKRNAEAQAMRTEVLASPGAEKQRKQDELKTLRESLVAAAKGAGGVTFEGTKYARPRAVKKPDALRWKADLAKNRARYVSLGTELDPSVNRAKLEKELNLLEGAIDEAITFAD